MEFSRSILLALFISLVVHGLLAVGLVAYLEYAPAPDVVATLDLSSVELSFAEEADEQAAVVQMPPAPTPEAVKPRTMERKPPEPKAEKLSAPDPAAAKFREPDEGCPERIETPPKESERSVPPTPPQAAPVAPRQAKVEAPPQPKRSIRPDYPKGARQRGEQGDVVLEIRVGKDGSVETVRVVSSCGFSELDEAAVKAARGAKFTPARSGREAVPSTARITLSFRLKM